MRKIVYYIPLMLLFASSCGEYTKALKSRDNDYKFEFAKKAYDQKHFDQATTLLNEVVSPLRGTAKGEEALFLLGMAYYESKDYENSAVNFKAYYTRHPKGKYAELARFYSGYGYYLDSPEPQLDQTYTIKGIEELQGFLDYFPKSDRVTVAQNAIFELQDKLTLKELQNAQLYYNLGNFMGNNYESAIIVCQNALKTYPYSKYKEEFEMLTLKAKYQIAKQSVDERQADRYKDVVDEYYSFINNYPETKHKKEAETIFKLASKHAEL